MWTYNGIDLINKAWVVEEIDGFGIPGLKGKNTNLAGADGERWVKKMFESRRMPFKMRVIGVNPLTGEIDSTARAHLEANIDYLIGLLSTRKLNQLIRTMSDMSKRIAQAEVAGEIFFAGGDMTNYADFVVEFNLPDPHFYAETQRTIALPAGTKVVANPGTAESERFDITLTGPLTNPKITNTTNGVWLQLGGELTDGQTAIINTYDFTVTIGGVSVLSALTHGQDYRWLVLESGNNTLKLEGGAGSAELKYYPAYF